MPTRLGILPSLSSIKQNTPVRDRPVPNCKSNQTIREPLKVHRFLIDLASRSDLLLHVEILQSTRKRLEERVW
ncbi:hypothetical protein UC8_33330 [Roseimaritima ulvae]|uniref:Uncharacterized protein n=1 Tax=Roseimaritima ulvae TaxID=980254 RepID=A0A5B9QQP7_9BACT|nr:hypothetical protein UC8_33330 [Roseimaritima ulvae]